MGAKMKIAVTSPESIKYTYSPQNLDEYEIVELLPFKSAPIHLKI